MPEFDHDTIAALAEGRLDPERAREIERAIAEDPEAMAELVAQRTAIDAMRGAPSPILSTDERASLHAAVATAVGLEPATAPPTRRTRRAPWTAIGVAAAALVALAAVVPLTGILSNSSSATTAAFEAALTTTTTSTDRAALPPAADMSTMATVSGAVPAGETTTEAALGAAGGDDVNQTQLAEAFDKSYATTTATVPADETTPCRDEAAAALESTDLYTLSIEDESGEDIVVLFTVGPDGSVAAIGYSPTDCSVVFTEP